MIVFPILYIFVVIGLIIWQVSRYRQVTNAHNKCKAAISNYLEQENQSVYTKAGVQLILAYDTRTAMNRRNRFIATYKYLMVLPTIDVFLGEGIQNTPQTPYVAQPYQQQTVSLTSYGTGFQEMKTSTQPIAQYEKMDKNQRLL